MPPPSVKAKAAAQLPGALAAAAAKKNPPPAGDAVEITAEDAAKAVKRLVAKRDKDGKETGDLEEVEVTAEELFAWAKRGDRIVVVTTDGQKLEGAL